MRLLLLLSWLSMGSAWALEPAFTLDDLDGNEHTLAEYRGRWVVVNYWATWCPPCLQEMPELDHFQSRFEALGTTVLGINLEEIERDLLREFVAKLGVSYPILMSGPRPPSDMPSIRGLPTTHILSPQGEIVETRLGPVTSALLEDLIRTNGGNLP